MCIYIHAYITNVEITEPWPCRSMDSPDTCDPNMTSMSTKHLQKSDRRRHMPRSSSTSWRSLVWRAGKSCWKESQESQLQLQSRLKSFRRRRRRSRCTKTEICWNLHCLHLNHLKLISADCTISKHWLTRLWSLSHDKPMRCVTAWLCCEGSGPAAARTAARVGRAAGGQELRNVHFQFRDLNRSQWAWQLSRYSFVLL